MKGTWEKALFATSTAPYKRQPEQYLKMVAIVAGYSKVRILYEVYLL